VAPKVSGYIAQVLVRDNEAVRAGQVLAHIDDRDFRAALAQAQANVEAADAAVQNTSAQLVLQESLIAQADATVAATEATLRFANADAARYQALVRTGAASVQRTQQTEATRGQLAAQLQRDKAAVVAACGKVAVLAAQRTQAQAERDRQAAAAEQAALNLSYTTITAPVDGTVGARSLRVGQFVSAGTQLMAVVPLNAVYVVANFKETQLANVRAGQKVTLGVDGLPGATLTGRVDSISPASGLEFALLPPDNATGNFTKIVQRVPVRIALDPAGYLGRLRSGMSVEPTIDTRGS
jgi:membrane fusion protein (multidrug efflux system)